MYNLTRQETSDLLGISVRSVDRYIKAGKLRIKKDGKAIFVNEADVDRLKNGGTQKQHVIIKESVKKSVIQNNVDSRQSMKAENTELSTGKELKTLELIYSDLKKEIEKKDSVIQNLAIRVGKAEEIAKNSISINDFKKSQFLLEESKSVIASELEDERKNKKNTEGKLVYTKQINILLFIVSIFLFIVLFVVWFGGI